MPVLSVAVFVRADRDLERLVLGVCELLRRRVRLVQNQVGKRRPNLEGHSVALEVPLRAPPAWQHRRHDLLDPGSARGDRHLRAAVMLDLDASHLAAGTELDVDGSGLPQHGLHDLLGTLLLP